MSDEQTASSAAIHAALLEAGVSPDELAEWDEDFLSLRPDQSASGPNLAVVLAEVELKKRLQNYIIDLGHCAMHVERAKAEALESFLKLNNIPFDRSSLGGAWLAKKTGTKGKLRH
jgi:hypothetical protein